MAKLSSTLKAAISAAHARPHTVPAPKHIRSIYESIRDEASAKEVGESSWLTISTAATMTMNSPASLTELYQLAATGKDKARAVQTVELIREAALKCISFNGIPRVINCLGEFRASLPQEVVDSLSTESTREPTKENIDEIHERGVQTWNSIYAPFETKLYNKLALSHPNLPVHILNSHYGALLSDPADHVPGAKIGRVLTSVVAIACLRAQTGVGPQVTSHVFGLRKAFEDGSYNAAGEEEVQGGQWLASDEGNLWILASVDRIVEAIGEGQGTTFAPGLRAKL